MNTNFCRLGNVSFKGIFGTSLLSCAVILSQSPNVFTGHGSLTNVIKLLHNPIEIIARCLRESGLAKELVN